MPINMCLNCGKDFQWMPSQTSGKYCCHDCQITHSLKEKIDSGNFSKSNAMTYFKRTKEYKCSECGITEYNGKSIRLQIDHIDGNNSDHRQKNLRYLCPNCHTQTETWGVKNVSEEGAKRLKEASILGNKIKRGKVPKGTKLNDIMAV